MITEVIKEMWAFILVLILSILMFTDALLSLQKSYPIEDRRMENYIGTFYWMILVTFGHFDDFSLSESDTLPNNPR